MNYSTPSSILDKSIDIEHKPQVIIFLYYVTHNLKVKYELLNFITLKVMTGNVNIKNALYTVLGKYSALN